MLHSFLSRLSNTRSDSYGGSLENRARIVLEVLDAVRAAWPADKPVFLRISLTDWVQEDPADERAAWVLEESVVLSRWAAEHGADLIDVSSGGLVPANIPHREDYKTFNASQLKASSKTLVAAVGRIADAATASGLLGSGSADAVFVGRALLRDASWANNAAAVLGARGRLHAPIRLRRPGTVPGGRGSENAFENKPPDMMLGNSFSLLPSPVWACLMLGTPSIQTYIRMRCFS